MKAQIFILKHISQEVQQHVPLQFRWASLQLLTAHSKQCNSYANPFIFQLIEHWSRKYFIEFPVFFDRIAVSLEPNRL